MNMNNLHDLEKLVTQVRRDILRMVHKVNSGHPGGSLGCAEYFVALYNEMAKISSFCPMDIFLQYTTAFWREEATFLLKSSIHFDYWIQDFKVIQPHTKACQVSELHQAHWVKVCLWR